MPDEPGLAPSEPAFDVRSPDRLATRGAIELLPELVRDVPAVAVDPRDRRAAPELSDDALVAAVEAAKGVVIIDLKPADVPRTRESGVYPAIARAEVAAARRTLEQRGARILMTMRTSSITVLEIEPRDAPALRSLPYVNTLAPSGTAQPGLVQQDTTWGVKKIGADWAWTNVGALGQYVNVTLIDTGVDATHLNNYSLDGPADLSWDCLYVPQIGLTDTCYERNMLESHGSAMASIINARDNAAGEIGVAPALRNFASIKVCHWINGQFDCPLPSIIAALDWVTAQGLPRHVVNLSIQRCGSHDPTAQALARAANAGALLVSIAGNTDLPCPSNPSGVLFPGSHSSTIAVSGTLWNDEFATASASGCEIGSRSGSQVDLAAPFIARTMQFGGGWAEGCGTSGAGAFVTGAAALIWSQHLTETASQIRNRLLFSAQLLAGGSQPHLFGHGRVSVFNALYTPPPPPLSASITGASAVPAATLCNWIGGGGFGTPPYSFAWYVDWVPQTSTADVFSLTTPSAGFTIQLRVTDAASNVAWAHQSVDVDALATCSDQ